MTNEKLLESPWRKDFPAFCNFSNEKITWLDSAATTQKPNAVINCITHYYQQGCANIHRAQYPLATKITHTFENVRHKVAKFLNAQTSDQIIFTRSTTESINLLAYGLENYLSGTGDIVISALEHHANLLPWQQLAKRKGLNLIVLPLTHEGVIDIEIAETLITNQTKLVAISQMSNVFGTLQPIKQIIDLANKFNALTLIDGAQGIVHQPTDVTQLNCDFYVFSGHKLFAPEGVGILYGKTDSLAKLSHWQLGGEMVQSASYEAAQFYPAPLGFEAGTSAIGAVLGLGAAIDYLNIQDRTNIASHEQALTHQLLTGLLERKSVHVLGKSHSSLVSFNIAGVHSSDISHLLAEQNIAIRAGQHCCMPLYKTLGLNGAIRVSFALYNNATDIHYFFEALDKAIELLT